MGKERNEIVGICVRFYNTYKRKRRNLENHVRYKEKNEWWMVVV